MSVNISKTINVAKVILVAISLFSTILAADQQKVREKISWEQYLKNSAASRESIDVFLSGPSWGQFDPEVGYTQRNYLDVGNGIDHSAALYTFQANGARTSFMYADRIPRINTYGDSFTESEQVSDGETWQEYLAGHLGEPIRNFGIGGYGVYQAFRRMEREEQTDHGAKYVILYICCDDATRSLLRARYASIYAWFSDQGGRRFHGNFTSHVEMDLSTGRFVEKEQLLSTKESLYHMTEPQWMFDNLKDDLALQLDAYAMGYIRDLDRERITHLAAKLDFPFDWSLESQTATVVSSHPERVPPRTAMQVQAAALLNRYGQRATLFILDKAREFARQNNKKLLIVLNQTTDMGRSGLRDDQEILDYLSKQKFDYFDMNGFSLREYQNAKTALSYGDYEKQYQVNGFGHYNPLGNHRFAYSIKDTIVKWLDPKPIPYQQSGAQAVNFEGYLHGGAYH